MADKKVMLTQSEKIDKIAEMTNETKASVERILKAFVEVSTQDLVENGRTKIQDFGVIEVRYRKGRNGVNPRTQEPKFVEEMLTVGMQPSSKIKKTVKENVNISEYRK